MSMRIKTWMPVAMLVLLITVSAGVSAWAGSAQEPPTRLDVLEAVSRSLKTDPQVLTALATLQTAEANVKKELAVIAPGCSITGNYGFSPVWDRTVPADPQVVYQNGGMISFKVTQTIPGLLPVMIGEKTVSAVEQAMWTVADARAAFSQARVTSAAATIQKYLTVLRTSRQLELSLSALKLAGNDERMVNAQLEAGMATRIDVLKAQNSRERAALEVQSARNKHRNALDALLVQLGLNPGVNLELEPIQTVVPPPTPNHTGLLAQALEGRSEVFSAKTRVRKAENDLTQARNARLPAIQLSGAHRGDYHSLSVSLDPVTGQFSWSAEGRVNQSGSSFSAGFPSTSTPGGFSVTLSFAWSPYDAGKQKALVAAAEASLESARIALARVEAGIGLELSQLLNELAMTQLQLAQSRRERDLSIETRNLAQVRYQEGLALFTELAQATQALAQAESALVQAEYDVLLALVNLELACGRMPSLIDSGRIPG